MCSRNKINMNVIVLILIKYFAVVRKNANGTILYPNAVHDVLVEPRLLTFLRPLYIAFMDRWSRFLS